MHGLFANALTVNFPAFAAGGPTCAIRATKPIEDEARKLSHYYGMDPAQILDRKRVAGAT